MEIYVDEEIFKICKKEIRLFKSKCLDDNYDLFKDNDNDRWNMLFLQCMCSKPKNMKYLKTKLLNHGIEEKTINDLIYTILKFDYKYDNGIFSYYELDEWDVDLDRLKKPTLTYTLI
jgi:hypothetical protein